MACGEHRDLQLTRVRPFVHTFDRSRAMRRKKKKKNRKGGLLLIDRYGTPGKQGNMTRLCKEHVMSLTQYLFLGTILIIKNMPWAEQREEKEILRLFEVKIRPCLRQPPHKIVKINPDLFVTPYLLVLLFTER